MIRIKNINALFLALAPILAVYTLSNGILLYFFIIVLLVLLNFFGGNLFYAIKVKRYEVQWYFSVLIIGLLGFLLNKNEFYFNALLYFNNFIALTLFFFALIICTANFNVEVLRKTLLFLGVAAAIICVFQRIQLLLTGSFYKDFFLPGLEVKRDLETFTKTRVSAFFTEPAHLSIYLLPIFYIALIEKKRLISIILGLGILFSGSTTGLLLVSLLIILYLVKNSKTKIYILVSILCVFSIYLGILSLFPDVMNDNIEKLNSIDFDGVRLFGPLKYLNLYDGSQLCFGIGLNQLSDFLHSNGLYVENEWGVEKNANYANAIIYMLLCYGVFGLYFFARYFLRTISSNKSDSGFVVYALGIFLSDQILFNMNLLYVLMFLVVSNQIIKKSESV